jgi:anti-sigma B factor antagonist
MLRDGPRASVDPPPVLRIERRRWRNGYLITLSGELDLHTAPDMRADVSELLGERPLPDSVVIDLSEVTFMDSLGLGTLVVGHRICGELGVRLTVRNPSPFVDRMLTVSGFAQRLLRDV